MMKTALKSRQENSWKNKKMTLQSYNIKPSAVHPQNPMDKNDHIYSKCPPLSQLSLQERKLASLSRGTEGAPVFLLSADDH
jgi:hypothetical protein